MVDTIKSVYPSPWVDFYTGPDLVEDARVKTLRRNKFLAAVMEWEYDVRYDLPNNFNTYQGPSGRNEAFWRILVTDSDGSYPPKRPVGNNFAGRFEAWMGRGEKIDEEAYVQSFRAAVITSCLYKSFATTQNGYLILVSHKVTPGELVCTLRGGKFYSS